MRKYYLNGEAGGGGVYLWESEAAARAWYTPEWEKRMEAAFGAKPTVTYYDNHVVVDNEAGKVRVEGLSADTSPAKLGRDLKEIGRMQ